MSSINDIVQRVKAHPLIAGADVTGLPDGDFAFAVAQLILVALPGILEAAAGTTKQDYVLTDPATTTVTLDSEGAASLASLITSTGILLESLEFGEIYHPDSPHALVRVAYKGEALLGSNWASFGYLRYWIVGSKIYTFSADSNETPLSGDLSFAVPRVVGLDTLPVGFENDLVDSIVLRLKGVTPKEPKKAVA